MYKSWNPDQLSPAQNTHFNKNWSGYHEPNQEPKLPGFINKRSENRLTLAISNIGWLLN
jgi:hypothetical protein